MTPPPSHPPYRRAHWRARVDLDVSLRTLRAALVGDEDLDGLDDEVRLRLIRDVFRVLDRELCAGAGLPTPWRRWWTRRRSMDRYRR